MLHTSQISTLVFCHGPGLLLVWFFTLADALVLHLGPRLALHLGPFLWFFTFSTLGSSPWFTRLILSMSLPFFYCYLVPDLSYL